MLISLPKMHIDYNLLLIFLDTVKVYQRRTSSFSGSLLRGHKVQNQYCSINKIAIRNLMSKADPMSVNNEMVANETQGK